MVDYIDTFGNGGGPLPRWKNVLSFTSEAGSWTNTLSVRSTAGFRDTDNIVDNPNAPRVKSHTELDLVGSYRGFKSIEINYGIKNLLDEMPPFSYTNANSNQYTQQGFAELYSSRGRFYFAGLNYKFR
jgi:iron complex outermembrane receptor protein